MIQNFNNVVLDYLVEMTDWKWQSAMTLMDYHSSMIRFVNQKTDEEKETDKINKEGEIKTIKSDYDIDVIAKVNKQKGELLDQAISAREKADKLILEIKKEYVHTDTAVQQDFGFSFTETYKKKDIYSWREFIKETNLKKKSLSTGGS